MESLIHSFEILFKTDLIIPSIFKDLPILGFFSKKLPYPFNSEFLNSFNSFNLFFPKQTHSTKIIEVNEKTMQRSFFEIEGDGTFTFNKKIFLGVRTADCVPILITNKDADFVAALHGGWRGSVKRILSKFLQKIINLGINPKEILIAIGPHIKVCCYEVGEEVLEKLKMNFENFKKFIIFRERKIFLDLEQLNIEQALEFSVPLINIWTSKDCTYCFKDSYWSHRFHKNNRGFQISLIGKLK
ncbi:MAG: peptidoglycan editing factor PgeF [Thermodesulfobacterium geofontis]|uniref:Purine nucleoside phosphorylase n=1 Tax=Thermodesulfobacterium geofontis TaxID=1295609 RepID=A0A2N7Q5L6_9BACT|nr:MAG: peptidoglycan editing factor PgeF [Thermodesulfobacterium geofontis]